MEIYGYSTAISRNGSLDFYPIIKPYARVLCYAINFKILYTHSRNKNPIPFEFSFRHIPIREMYWLMYHFSLSKRKYILFTLSANCCLDDGPAEAKLFDSRTCKSTNSAHDTFIWTGVSLFNFSWAWSVGFGVKYSPSEKLRLSSRKSWTGINAADPSVPLNLAQRE